MIRQQNREAITQRDELVEEMVSKAYQLMQEMGEFETVHEIFGKLPISRIEKEQYVFLFDSVRQNVSEILGQQDQLQKILQRESEAIRKIEVKTYAQKNKGQEKNGAISKPTVTIGNYDFSHLIENCFQQKPMSGKPIFKCILYLKNQDRKGKEFVGEVEPFLPNQGYINFREIKYQIGDIRLLLEDEPPLKRYQFEFADENKLEFSSRSFPSNEEIQRRAQTLAKLYLLHLYREQGRKAKQIYKSNEIDLNKQREIRKIKQEMDVEKMKEGEMIEEMDLIKQVYKILMLIERKMNELAFAQFQSKNGDKATIIKRSLQKLKRQVHQEPSAKNKLKILITYKHKKGW